jgi:hypothetical protein
MNAFCTIVTGNYAAYAAALHESLVNNSSTGHADIFVLISSEKSAVKEVLPQRAGLHYMFLNELCESGPGKRLRDKYEASDINAFRWSMKGVLLKHLLNVKGVEKAIFLDGDIFFFSGYDFLFTQLERARVLLSPHWRSRDPLKDPMNFQQMLNRGIYNAGFIAVNRSANPILDWWLELCIFKCEIDPRNGYYGDQSYLNLFHVYFDGVENLSHKGCNIANWNRIECERVKREDGEVWINNEFPVVFVHFTANTMRTILKGRDALLMPYLKLYSETLKKYAPETDLIEKFRPQPRQKKTFLDVLKGVVRRLTSPSN